jgi:hypothetical protein
MLYYVLDPGQSGVYTFPPSYIRVVHAGYFWGGARGGGGRNGMEVVLIYV